MPEFTDLLHKRPDVVGVFKDQADGCDHYWFFCPGCNCLHGYKVGSCGHSWTFSGTRRTPTFKPSLLVNKHNPKSRCHLFVTEGKIQFLSDCHHELAGKTIEMEEIHHHL
jgi:hypothetical protein